MAVEKRQPKAFLACYLVLIRNGRILLSRRANTGFHDGEYSMIAGHLEDEETVFDAMVREAREEAGLALEPRELKVVHILHRQDIDREYVDFFVSSDTVEEPQNLEPGKCAGFEWFDMRKLPKSVIPYVRQAIDCIGKGKMYSECKVSPP